MWCSHFGAMVPEHDVDHVSEEFFCSVYTHNRFATAMKWKISWGKLARPPPCTQDCVGPVLLFIDIYLGFGYLYSDWENNPSSCFSGLRHLGIFMGFSAWHLKHVVRKGLVFVLLSVYYCKSSIGCFNFICNATWDCITAVLANTFKR